MGNPDGASPPKTCRFDPLEDGTVPAGEVLGRVEGERGGYVIQAGKPVGDGGLELEPGHYLIFTNLHVPMTDRVLGFSDTVATLKFAIPEFRGLMPGDRLSHITYELEGAEMGRTVPGHAHVHVFIGTAAEPAAKFAAVPEPAKS